MTGGVTHKAKVCRAGNYVKQGELLIEIDPRDYEIEIRRLEKELEQATNSIKELEVEIANTESLIELAEEELAIQQDESERLKELFENSVITESEIDQTRRTELIAKTAVLTLRNQLHLKTTSRGRLESIKDRVSVSLEKAKLDLSRAKITAPVSGMVVADSVEEDSYVRKGTELATIEDTSAVEVKCSLRVDELAWIWRPVAGRNFGARTGRPVAGLRDPPGLRLRFVYRLDGRDCEWSGSLCRYDGIGLDEATRTVPCRVVVANPTDGRPSGPATEIHEGCPPALVRGMFVDRENPRRRAGRSAVGSRGSGSAGRTDVAGGGWKNEAPARFRRQHPRRPGVDPCGCPSPQGQR